MWRRLIASGLLLSSRQASGQFNLDGLAKINPDSIAQSLGNVNPSKVAEALKDAKIPETVKNIAPEKAMKAIETTGTAAKVSEAVGALKDAGVQSVPKVGGPDRPEVSGAIKAVGESLEQAAHKLNGTKASKVEETLRESHQRTQSLADVLQQSLPKDIVEKVQHADPHKVEKVISVAGGKIAEAIKDGKAKEVAENPEKLEEVLEAMETMDWWSTHWYYVVLTLVLLSLTCAMSCYVYRTIWAPSPRSPNLLVDSEINMWVRSGGGHQWEPPSAEEQGFRQF